MAVPLYVDPRHIGGRFIAAPPGKRAVPSRAPGEEDGDDNPTKKPNLTVDTRVIPKVPDQAEVTFHVGFNPEPMSEHTMKCTLFSGRVSTDALGIAIKRVYGATQHIVEQAQNPVQVQGLAEIFQRYSQTIKHVQLIFVFGSLVSSPVALADLGSLMNKVRGMRNMCGFDISVLIGMRKSPLFNDLNARPADQLFQHRCAYDLVVSVLKDNLGTVLDHNGNVISKTPPRVWKDSRSMYGYGKELELFSW